VNGEVTVKFHPHFPFFVTLSASGELLSWIVDQTQEKIVQPSGKMRALKLKIQG
jgi:hypothetical protein